MTPATTFAWFEKLELLLLAAHLEEHGWSRVRLSVPPDDLRSGGTDRGTDWARAIEVVKGHRQAFGLGEGRLRQAMYEAEPEVDTTKRANLRAELPEFLQSALLRDQQYRYDGIWHDNEGNLDLVAWGPAGVLMVEAKGVSKRMDSIVWGRATLDTLALVHRVVGSAELPHARRGLLLPDDRGAAPRGRGFVGTLLRAWPHDRAEDGTNPIYLVAADGVITEWTVASLR
jgi:hypothetical protein